MTGRLQRWEAIAAEVRTEILGGLRAPGSRFTTTRELMVQYDASHETVQTAVNRLKDEDLIVSRPGIGWFVCDLWSVRLIRSSPNWFARNTRPDTGSNGGWHPRISTTARPGQASPEVAVDLKLAVGTEVWTRRRRVLNGDQVIHLGETHLPRALTRRTSIEDVTHQEGGTYGELNRAGHRITGFAETIEARLATSAESQALGIDARRPLFVLRIARVALSGDRPLEVDYITAPAGRLSLVYELPSHDHY